MRSSWLVIFSMGIFLAAHSVNGFQEFSKKAELSPIVCSYEDVTKLLENLQGQLVKANGTLLDGKSERVDVTVAAGEDTLSLNNWEPVSKVKGLPDPGKSLWFRYVRYNSPVSEVVILLSDSSRTIAVTGQEASQVSAVFAYIRNELEKHKAGVGGTSFRNVAGMVILILGSSLASLGIARSSEKWFRLVGVISIPIIASTVVFSWAEWFPGFAVYYGSYKFIDRNINNISVLLALIGLASPVIWWAINKFISGTKNMSNDLSPT